MHANLEHANLWHANLRNADFFDANLKNANLTDVNLVNVFFGHAILKNTKFKNADITNVEFKDIEDMGYIVENNFENTENIAKEQVLSAQWGIDNMRKINKPPILPDKLMEDDEIKEWCRVPDYEVKNGKKIRIKKSSPIKILRCSKFLMIG